MTHAIFDYDEIRRRRNIMLGMESSGRVLNYDGTPAELPMTFPEAQFKYNAVLRKLLESYLAPSNRPLNWRVTQDAEAKYGKGCVTDSGFTDIKFARNSIELTPNDHIKFKPTIDSKKVYQSIMGWDLGSPDGDHSAIAYRDANGEWSCFSISDEKIKVGERIRHKLQGTTYEVMGIYGDGGCRIIREDRRAPPEVITPNTLFTQFQRKVCTPAWVPMLGDYVELINEPCLPRRLFKVMDVGQYIELKDSHGYLHHATPDFFHRTYKKWSVRVGDIVTLKNNPSQHFVKDIALTPSRDAVIVVNGVGGMTEDDFYGLYAPR